MLPVSLGQHRVYRKPLIIFCHFLKYLAVDGHKIAGDCDLDTYLSIYAFVTFPVILLPVIC